MQYMFRTFRLKQELGIQRIVCFQMSITGNVCFFIFAFNAFRPKSAHCRAVSVQIETFCIHIAHPYCGQRLCVQICATEKLMKV